MSITATCGHVLAEDEGPDGEGLGWSVTVGGYARDNTPCLNFVTYCTACRDAALADGRVLADDKAQRRWLEFGDERPVTVGYMVGRFNPLQNGHLALLQHVHDHNDHLVVLVGSSNEGRTRRNPLTFEERRAVLQGLFPNATVLPLPDQPDDEAWVQSFEGTIAQGIEALALGDNARVRMYSADATRADDYALRCSWVQNLGHEVVGFPPVVIHTDLSATLIRDSWYNGRYDDIAELVPSTILALLRQLDASGFPGRFQAIEQAPQEAASAPRPIEGTWEVRKRRPNGPVVGHFKGTVDDIAFELDVSEDTVLYFHPSDHADPAELTGKRVRESAAVDVLLEPEVRLASRKEDIRPFFANRPVYADYNDFGSCVRLVALSTQFGQRLLQRRQALDAVLTKLTNADIQVLQDSGLHV